MSDELLNTIEHVLHDFDTSDDAMRWTPEVVPTPAPVWDQAAFAAAVGQFARAYRDAQRKLVEHIAQMTPILQRAFRLMSEIGSDVQVRRSAMRSEYRRRTRRRNRR